MAKLPIELCQLTPREIGLMQLAFNGGYSQGYHTDSNEIYPHDQILDFEGWLKEAGDGSGEDWLDGDREG